jgi:peptidoglycan/xylan/chitin deacetylase (PgdA/CDA1 family)
VVTDKVGATADWDSRHGAPAPLLTWREIAEVHRQGVFIGSHLATHRPASALSMDQLIEEAARSRFTLEARLQTSVRSVAMPFGDWDQRLIAALVWAGYEIGFSVEDGVATGGQPLFTLPRIEVRGNEDLSIFAGKLERAREDPAPAQQRIAVTASRDAGAGDAGRAAPRALAFDPGLAALAGGTPRAESGGHG